MSSFFTTPASQKKRKRSEFTSDSTTKRPKSRINGATTGSSRPVKRKTKDDEISGSDSESVDSIPGSDIESESSDNEETEAERRIKLAQKYLDGLRETVDPAGFDAADIDRDLIAERLKEDAAESKGKIYRHIASDISFPTAQHTSFRSDHFGLTAVAVCAPYAYMVSKDLSITKWKLPDISPSSSISTSTSTSTSVSTSSNFTPRRKPKLIKTFTSSSNWAKKGKRLGHTAAILCAAVSQSGKFLATGGEDKRIIIWDTETLKPIKAFNHHRDTVFALSFRRNTHTLYSASGDRTIKIWNLDALTYVETLFGHEDKIIGIVGLSQEKCISVGARDRSARLWKVIEESQLVFRGGGSGTKAEDGNTYVEGSIDCVAMIDEDTFVTGSDNGNISLWSVLRKKPVFTIPLAHGADEIPEADIEIGDENSTKERKPTPRWITALNTIPYSDVILSGSWDGYIRAWKISEDKRRLESVGKVGEIKQEPYPAINGNHAISTITNSSHKSSKIINGLVNSIAVFEKGDRGEEGISIIAAVSKEHRLGKWKRIPKGRCEGIIFQMQRVEKVHSHINGIHN